MPRRRLWKSLYVQVLVGIFAGVLLGYYLPAADFVLNIIPTTFVDAFAKGEILPVLLLSVLSGLALLQLGERVRPLVALVDQAAQALFQIVGMIMRLAPIGAFGATAFTIG